MNGDPKKYPEWYKRYLRGIMQVESSGGNPDEFINPRSSATGMYQQLYKQLKDLPVMQGVDRQGFAADTALQNKVMGMRFLDDLPGVTGELRNARDLTERFQPQFGDKWDYRPDEVAAMTYFIGRQGTINYLNHLLKGGKPEDFKVSGNNMTVPKYMQVYNEGFGAVEEQPEERQISPELQNAIDIMKRDNRFGGKVKKKKNYGQNGMLVQKDPTLVSDPPQGTITPQEALARALQPDNQFRLRGGDAPFKPIKEKVDPVESLGKGIAEAVRMLPFAGEVVDTYELGQVAATGEDVYGEEQDPGLFAALTAAGYVIPNVLEKPLKSAWRAIKKFPAKMPKKEFRELMGPEKEQVRANLTQGHLETYGHGGYETLQSGARPVNVRQLPSLMSGSKLENAVGKDGMIQVSQIENLINSKDVSAVEKEALKDALFKARVQQGEAEGLAAGAALPDKIDYLNFKRAGSDVVSTRRGDATFFVDESKEYADYGVDRLGLDVRLSTSRDMALADDVGLARTNLIRTTDPELQSTEYGHYGTDVIGHYRTFERPDEEGVLYISELQADPLQARGPAGKKTVALDIGEKGPNPKQANLIKNQDQFLISHILEQEAKGADKLRFPTGETTSKIQGYGDPSGTISRAKADVEMHEANVKANRESSFVKNTFKKHPMFKGKSDDEVFKILDTESGSSDFNKRLDEGYRQAGMLQRSELFDWYFATQELRSAREHLSRVNASEQATQGIMKGYDRLPKALKKHGLDATKVTDDVGNTWWEVDIPARLGEGVGEIRAYRKGGQVSDKIRVLKKEGKPQDQAVAIALAMQQKGQL